ncbi:MAG: single-stranded DNA-binding protein [Candidatus Pacebacteria bacterium]|nr:single-stranded DNA-binding protein [Candidatus Paceibacterota bacterium]
MASLNRVLLLGNLTRDPDLKYTQGGTAVCNFGLAMNRRFKTRDGQDQEEVCFVDIEVFGRQAETCENYLQKGSPALVEGRLRLDRWEDRSTGQPRSRLRVTALRVQFMGSPGGGDDFSDRGTDRPQQEATPETSSTPTSPPPQQSPGTPGSSENSDNDIDDEIPF